MESEQQGTVKKRRERPPLSATLKKRKTISNFEARRAELLSKLNEDFTPELRFSKRTAPTDADFEKQCDLESIRQMQQILREKILDKRNEEKPIVEDASKGTFPYPVRAYNFVDNEPLPDVIWTERNVGQGGKKLHQDTNFVSGCDCLPTCTDPSACLCCHEMQDKFAYDEQGRVITEIGFPIYECNEKCICAADCRNKVVSRGPQYPVELFKTKKKGWGVRAVVDIPKGTFITEYIGEIIDNHEAERRGHICDANKCSYLYDLDMETKENCLCIDANSYGNVSRFFNHSCNPNLQNYQVWIETWDKRMPHVAFFTNRDVRMGEELTFDYKYELPKGEVSIPCHCGAVNCKSVLF